MRPHRPLLLALVAALALAGVPACGQKGPLYLPDAPPPAKPAPAPAPATKPAPAPTR